MDGQTRVVELLQASTPNSRKTVPMLVLNAILTPSNSSKPLALLSALSIPSSSYIHTTSYLVAMTVGRFRFKVGHTVIGHVFGEDEVQRLLHIDVVVCRF